MSENVFSKINHFFTVMSGENTPSVKRMNDTMRSTLVMAALCTSFITYYPLSKHVHTDVPDGDP
jgi:hypothetical protein